MRCMCLTYRSTQDRFFLIAEASGIGNVGAKAEAAERGRRIERGLPPDVDLHNPMQAWIAERLNERRRLLMAEVDVELQGKL